MRVIALIILSVFAALPAWAGHKGLADLLNTVSFKLSAEQWVTTKTALVTVGVHASVSDSALANIQENVLKKLNQLSDQGEWHVVSFDRSLDQSGLEKVQILAQARLPSSAIPNLRDKAKSMSKAGETFTLDNVQFVPSEEELRAANTALRSNVYQQAKEEVDRLNKLYPEQKYSVHEVNFISDMMQAPMPQVAFARTMKDAGAMNNLAVGDKLILSATVVCAAAPDQALLKMMQ